MMSLRLRIAVAIAVLAALSVTVRPQGVVTFRLIVLESQEAADRMLARLRSGENFVALAAALSVDPSGANGGLIGPLSPSDLRPEIRNVLNGLRPDDLSAVVRLPTGYGILKLVPNAEAPAGAVDTAASSGPTVMGSVPTALSAAGNVRYVYDFSGYSDTVLALRNVAMSADDKQDLAKFCDIRKKLVVSAQTLVGEALTAADTTSSSVPPIDRVMTYVLKAQLDVFHGDMTAAITALEKTDKIAAALVPAMKLQLTEALGIAHLHKAEQDNGLFDRSTELDLLPLKPGVRFTKAADLMAAIRYFMRYLAEAPDEYEVRWLLNIAHMYAGTYPAGVPKAYLIPPAAFASAESVGRFVDVADRAGLASVSLAGGVIVDDFDGDGLLDVVTSNFDSCAPLRLFRHLPDGRFVEQGARAGLGGQLGGLNIMQTDYNNDGLLDIFVLRGAWEMPQRKSLLRNNGDGTFTDVTAASGLAEPVTGSQAAVWTDIDNDGYLDLFVGNENGLPQLFHNRGDGTFEDIAAKAGVTSRGFTKGVTAGDYDNDGWPDLYVSNLGGTNFLYHNNRNGTFTELGRGAGVPGPGQGFPTWFFDYDNDGYDDLFVGSFVASVDEVARDHLRLPRNGQTLKLYHNLHDGSFEDVTKSAGLDKSLMVMGANFGDIDNDGFLDMYLGTGNPSYASLVPSLLLRNKGGKSFVDVTASSGTGELHKGHGVAFADVDQDGDEDIVFGVGGATPGDAHALRLFANPGNGNDWITLKLVGVKTNRAAIGARITVTAETAQGPRTMRRTVGSGGSFGANPLQQHVGLGAGVRKVDVDIWWPTSNTHQRFSDVGKNRFLEITEFAQAPRALERPVLPLGQ